jgi:hypothetical protein
MLMDFDVTVVGIASQPFWLWWTAAERLREGFCEPAQLMITSTCSTDDKGVRVQVLRRQPDGSSLRVIDRPETP